MVLPQLTVYLEDENKGLYTHTNLRPPIKINFRWLNVKNKMKRVNANRKPSRVQMGSQRNSLFNQGLKPKYFLKKNLHIELQKNVNLC